MFAAPSHESNGNVVFVTTASGPLMDSLKALLSTIPQIEQVISLEDATTLLHVMAEYKPRLIVLDYDSVTSEIGNILGQTRMQSPDTHFIILVDSIEEQHRVEMAEDVTVLLKGSSPTKLFSAVENVFSP
jgi:DNA-binding NarL/FixJ family response regulator